MSDKSDWPPSFSVSEGKVLNLFTGDRFYSSKDASLREAILNAIDACGRRKVLENDDYERRVEVTFDTSSNIVTVKDNGDGMDSDEIRSLFTKIAESATAIRANGESYNSVGEFGIGVLSYFLVCDSFEVHTFDGSSEPLGIELTKEMLDAKTKANSIDAKRNRRGTTLILNVRDKEKLHELKERFSYWVRDVEYLTAKEKPGNNPIEQGGLTTSIRELSLSNIPEWAEEVNIGPPTSFSSWEHLQGNGRVDLLYKGIFVEEINPDRLWGLEGAIHVDPDYFEAKLNREGFIGDNDRQKIESFLQETHPQCLKEAVNCIDQIDFDSYESWSTVKWVSLWLAIPRNAKYDEAASVWDEKFRDLDAFELLLPDDQSSSVSISSLDEIDVDTLYLAPPRLNRLSVVGRQAVRVLRARGDYILQGQRRDNSYLRNASYSGNSSMDILKYFSDDLPTLKDVSDVQQDIVAQEAQAEIYSDSPRVLVVRLGDEGSPLVQVGNQIWVNCDVENGKEIISEICTLNDGYTGVWLACLKFAPNEAEGIANVLSDSEAKDYRLGIVKRQYLRQLIR